MEGLVAAAPGLDRPCPVQAIDVAVQPELSPAAVRHDGGDDHHAGRIGAVGWDGMVEVRAEIIRLAEVELNQPLLISNFYFVLYSLSDKFPHIIN